MLLASPQRQPEPSMTDQKTNEQASQKDPPAASAGQQPTGSLSWFQTIRSGLLAGLGVQSSSNRERDFQQGSVMRFVTVGVCLTAIFVLSLLFLVKALVN
jgi:hypothetical protein